MLEFTFNPGILTKSQSKVVRSYVFCGMLMQSAGLTRITDPAADYLRLLATIPLSLGQFTELGCAWCRAVVTPDLVQRLMLADYQTNDISLTAAEWYKRMEGRNWPELERLGPGRKQAILAYFDAPGRPISRWKARAKDFVAKQRFSACGKRRRPRGIGLRRAVAQLEKTLLK